jgi:threonine dehydrogenase-like Zn-dependent dehydrogenase
MSQKAKVSVFYKPREKPKIWNVDIPTVHDDMGIIEIKACGVCGTDVHMWEGKWPTQLPWPITLGHEIAGIVLKLGKNIKEDYVGNEIKEGDKVTIPPVIPCGKCYYCKHYPTRSNKCRNPIYYGHTISASKPPHMWGGWAEKLCIDFKEYPSTTIYKLPNYWPEKLGALVEPLTSCMRALERAYIGSTHAHEGYGLSQTVVIQGSGTIGLLSLVAARESGAKKVIVIGAPEKPRLELCREFGADVTINIQEVEKEERIGKVIEVTKGLGADVVMECAGAPEAVPEGIEMVRDGGVYVEMGQFTDMGSVLTNWNRICSKDLTIVGSWAYTPENIPDAISLIDRCLHKYPWHKIQSHIFRLEPEEILSAIKMAQRWECMKATIVP